MPPRSSRSAAAFARELADDLQHQARLRAQVSQAEALVRMCAEDEAGLVADLRAVGSPVASVWDLVEQGGASGNAVPVLVTHREHPHHPRVWEGVVRSLATPEARSGALEQLRRVYLRENDSDRRWVVANAIGSMACISSQVSTRS